MSLPGRVKLCDDGIKIIGSCEESQGIIAIAGNGACDNGCDNGPNNLPSLPLRERVLLECRRFTVFFLVLEKQGLGVHGSV